MEFTSLEQVNTHFAGKFLLPYEDYSCIEQQIFLMLNGKPCFMPDNNDVNKGKLFNFVALYYESINNNNKRDEYLFRGGSSGCLFCKQTLVRILFAKGNYEQMKKVLDNMILARRDKSNTHMRLITEVLTSKNLTPQEAEYGRGLLNEMEDLNDMYDCNIINEKAFKNNDLSTTTYYLKKRLGI